MIRLRTATDLGQLLRRLRHDRGLSLSQLAIRAHVSTSGASKRELRGVSTVSALIDVARVLDHDVALVPRKARKTRHADRRPTGTGWPA